MEVISSKDVMRIVKDTLNHVDSRLVGHGDRVAFMVYKMLLFEGIYTKEQRIKLCALAMLHDIGAYKTEHIDALLNFETEDVWEHAVYGYLFLKNMAPLEEYVEAVLYHHLAYEDRDKIPLTHESQRLGGLIHLADRLDVMKGKPKDERLASIKKNSGTLFDPRWVEVFCQAEQAEGIFAALESGAWEQEFSLRMAAVDFSHEEKKQYLRMVAYAIDFRSVFTVLHTVTTVSVSLSIAHFLCFSGEDVEEIYYGALLHDLGKVAIPLEILEKNGKLTFEEMEVMKEHVRITGDILGDYLSPNIKQIAVRHHEKMDGSGYPLGLDAKDLSIAERIVAVADILSALLRKRSYKEAFSKGTTIAILSDMRDRNKICPIITNIVVDNLDKILEVSENLSKGTLVTYEGLMADYETLLRLIQKHLSEA